MGYAEEIFGSFTKANILIVGDVMIDRYLSGSVNRISPEAPVPVVRLQREENRLGGAANVALNIRALGATPYLCSVIGKDENGDKFLALLPKAELSSKGIIQSANRRTTVKTRVIAQHQHLLRVDQEHTHDLSEEERRQYLDLIREMLDSRDIDAILFQDYNKGVLSREAINEIMLEAIKRDIPTAVDPKYLNFWAYKHVRLFKPNLKEIRAQVDFPLDPDLASLDRVADLVRSRLGSPYTLITLSDKGMYVSTQNGSEIIPTQPRAVADVCGAGDTVISVVTLGLALGMDLHQVARLANLAGGQVCEKVGVVPVDRADLLQEYEEYLQLENAG